MSLQEFLDLHADKKNVDQVIIECFNGNDCMHPDRPNIKIGKGAAIKNFRKHNNDRFICRKCDMYYNNPINKVGQGKRSVDQLNKDIEVICPNCFKTRIMKVSSYTGNLDLEPYLQMDGSCAQKGKVISEEQKEAIRQKLSGIKRSDKFKQKLSEYMRNNTEGIERASANLIPGIGGGWNEGLTTPNDVKQKQSKAMLGRKKTLEHRYHISIGRKKMLSETGGFTQEHREKLSEATILQYQRGFEPKTFHRQGYHFSPKLDKKVFYKSSYEKKVYMLLDSDDAVESYEYEAMIIKYYNPINKIDGNYIIDLKVNYKDGRINYIEIKPAKFLLEENQADDAIEAKAKVHTAFEKLPEMGLSFDVWTEIHLFGLIDTERKIREFVIWLDQQPEQTEENNNDLQ